MNTYVCGKCGYIAFGQAPDACPVCGAKKEAFELDNAAIKKPADAGNLSELEKKHIPVIDIRKQCGLVGAGCIDANIKVGAVLHAMEEKHFIMYIDLYLDYKFIARYHMAPDKLNPVVGVHLKSASGKLTALENCNLHGRWVAEAQV
jgi:superoxide reductase